MSGSEYGSGQELTPRTPLIKSSKKARKGGKGHDKDKERGKGHDKDKERGKAGKGQNTNPSSKSKEKKGKAPPSEKDDEDMSETSGDVEAPTFLAKRKDLENSRRRLNDAVTLFAVGGLIYIIVVTELCLHKIIERGETLHIFLLIILGISIVILVVLLLWFHILGIKLTMTATQKSAKETVTFRWLVGITVELVVCAVFPVPGLDNVVIGVPTYLEDQEQEDNFIRPIGDVLTIAMFIRLYLIPRALVLHSVYFRNQALRMLARSQHIRINFRFVLKVHLMKHPETVLLFIVASGILLASWFMRVCEAGTPPELGDFTFSNCVWLICITFLTVGYGDISPATPSGRAIAVLLGMFGAGCTALLVGLITNKLELNRREKFLSGLAQDMKLHTQLKKVAADIIKSKWLLQKAAKRGALKEEISRGKKIRNLAGNMCDIKQELQLLHEEGDVTLGDLYRAVQASKKSREQELEELKSLQETVTELNTKMDAVYYLLLGSDVQEALNV